MTMLTLPELFVAINTAGLRLVVTNGTLHLAGDNIDAGLMLALNHHRQTLQPVPTIVVAEPELRLKPSRCQCGQEYRRLTDELSQPGWFKVVCDNCKQWVGVRPTPRTCDCPADQWHAAGVDSRGWIKIECSGCHAFKGYRPPPEVKPKRKLTVATPKARQKATKVARGMFEADTAQSFALLASEEREADAMYESRGGLVRVPDVEGGTVDDCPF